MSLDLRVARLLEAKYEEFEHPRGRDGEWSAKPGSKARALQKRVERAVAKRAASETLKHGGVTISLKGDVPKEGYAFAPDASEAGYEHLVPKGDFTEADVQAYIDKNHALLEQDGNYIGAWEADGNVYLDVSHVGPPTPETLKAAQKAKQLAAFDLATFTEITLGHRDADGNYVAHDVRYPGSENGPPN